MKKFFIFSSLQDPLKISRWKLLGVLPFILLVLVYLKGSHERRLENPQDKLLPSPTQMVEAVKLIAFTPDKRSGEYLMWEDTKSSLRRMFLGIALASIV